MVTFPPCKINLGLNVVAKRSDGYHDLVTCYYPVPWCDVLEIVPSSSFSFHTDGRHIPGNTDSNLCVRAWQMLHDEFAIDPIEIHLLKHIPAGAGLGGGSSDGAYALLMLNDLFSLGLTQAQLAGYAARLGSDCPFFVYSTPMIGKGRGEQLDPANVSLKGKYLGIVKPDLHISTAEAFGGIMPRRPSADIRTVVEDRPVMEWKGLLKNDFETTIFPRFPLLEAIHQKMYALGAIYASLTGTGSAVYGIFDEEPAISDEFSNHICWTGPVD